jgi:cytochrome oxidase Cu insertion factor (SCO1/SenC/PrrC family)
MNDPNVTALRRGRRQLLLLAAMFFLPLVIAFWLYYGAGSWRPSGGTNQGDLLDPARPLPAVSLPLADGKPTGEEFLRGKWSLLYVGDGACDERCRRALYLMRQSHRAVGKDMDRVQRVFLVTGNCCAEAFLAQEHAGLRVVRLEGPDAAVLLAPFPVHADGPVGSAGRIYVADPLGNLLLSYSSSAPDKALLTDLKKLLRLSHIG